MKTYFVDGQFLPADKAVIPVTDLSVLRGYGVCDIMRTFSGRPYFLEAHVARLVNSAKEIGLDLPWTSEEIIDWILKTLEKNQPVDEVNIRCIITGGSSPDYFNPTGPPRLIILVTDLKKLPDWWYEKGVKVITIRQERPMPDAKVTAYIPAALALKDAQKQHAIEAIYVNGENHVLEGTTSNLFIFTEGCLVTPKDDVLKGITRKAILDLASRFFKVIERPVGLDEMRCAQEVFISGTNKSIVPVINVDDAIISDGTPGKNTKLLMQQMDNHARKFMEK